MFKCFLFTVSAIVAQGVDDSVPFSVIDDSRNLTLGDCRNFTLDDSRNFKSDDSKNFTLGDCGNFTVDDSRNVTTANDGSKNVINKMMILGLFSLFV